MSQRRKQFPFAEFEPRWQEHWESEKTFSAPNPGDKNFDASKPKFYALDMFPYPSGSGLHVGHPEGYTATDIISRFKRMNGFNVLHPMGWDAFGLPAEEHAIKTGEHPRVNTENNINNFRRQLKSLGFAYDWDREVATTDPEYVKWTQWIFLQLYQSYVCEETGKARPISELEDKGLSREEIDSKRLAYVADTPVNWSPDLGTVLANEEVEEWRAKGHTVERRPLRQWMLRITAYADRLIDDLEDLDWPDGIKLLQKNWIGRSNGAEVDFEISGETVTVFTTRPDTLFGATYMVLAPEHPLVEKITTDSQKQAVADYQKECATKSDLERTELAKDKTGVDTGGTAINPVNGEEIPVWISDYVMMGYGTGAIMAVPAHDERDYAFAKKFDIPIIEVVEPPKGNKDACFAGSGTAKNSDFLDGLKTKKAKAKIIEWLEKEGKGTKTVNFKLRDWLFSRQRYWGEPFPIIWKEDGNHYSIDESELPLLAPELDDYKPSGKPEGVLAKATDWIELDDGSRRETNTMPQWAGSCWYYLRYCDAKNDKNFISPEAEEYWLSKDGKAGGVDLYIGGTEHAVLHLLYARFWHKVLFDLGHLNTPEPFHKLVNQGLIMGATDYYLFRDSDDQVVSASDLKEIKEQGAFLFGTKSDGTSIQGKPLPEKLADVEKRDGKFFWKEDPKIEVADKAFKMSKSRGNVVNPDEVVEEYGADSLRLYEMFMGPLEQVKPWSMKGVEGVYRFLGKVWRLVYDSNQEGEYELRAQLVDAEPSAEANKVVHATIKKVGTDIENLSFNTAISQMMVCCNELGKKDELPVSSLTTLLQLLNPFAPHITEELHHVLQEAFDSIPAGDLANLDWPEFNEDYLIEDEIEIVVQVNGKVRDKIKVANEASKDDVEAQAMESEKVQGHIEGLTVRKVIVVPGRLVNIVAN